MDPYCFLKWDADRYKNEHDFNPRPCKYMTIQHPNDFSEPIFNEGILQEKDVLPFVLRPCQPFLHEVRVLLSPIEGPLPGVEERAASTYRSHPWPFTPETYREILITCGFFKSTHPSFPGRLNASKVVCDGITSMSLTAMRYWENGMRVLVSRDEKRQTTTIIIHRLNQIDESFLEGAMRQKSFWRLSVHPTFIFTIVTEIIRAPIFNVLPHTSTEAVQPMLKEELRRANSSTARMEAKNENMEEEAARALSRQQLNVVLQEHIEWALRAVKTCKSWCNYVDTSRTDPLEVEALRFAGTIILNRLEDIESRLEGDQVHAKKAQALTQVHRQSLEVQNATMNNKLNLLISSQSRDIARESKRDSSAMKAIALLTMFFLPGTFVAAFFAMPLFDWEASTSSSVVKTRFWIYWAVTIPATVIVLVLWRIWFKFDHWRMAGGEAGSFWNDAWTWLKKGRPEPELEKSMEEKNQMD